MLDRRRPLRIPLCVFRVRSKCKELEQRSLLLYSSTGGESVQATELAPNQPVIEHLGKKRKRVARSYGFWQGLENQKEFIERISHELGIKEVLNYFD